jgi:hypothetical protein
MYKTVFISHSRYDANLDFFHKIFSAVPIESVWMEFEDIKPPPSLSIKDNVNRSDALFVLLSQHLVDKQHTSNWVSFEVGLAANRKCEIYVFEPIDEHVDFAVPYFTHYMRYRTTENTLKWLRDGLRNGSIVEYGVSIKCPYNDCLIQFNYLSRLYTDSYYCPACRREVYFTKSYKDIDLDKLIKESVDEAIKELKKPN